MLQLEIAETNMVFVTVAIIYVKLITGSIPKTTMENPITKTRFNTFPTACVNGATRSRVLAASWKQSKVLM